MKKNPSTKKLLIFVYVLITYIFLQFFWWAYLLIELNKELYLLSPNSTSGDPNSRTLMIVGEGVVFIAFLIVGLFFMQRSVMKEVWLANQQRNFLLSITHELKTPISSIKLYLQTLQKRKEIGIEARDKICQSAIEDTERLNSLVENVLLATRIENSSYPINKEIINISELVRKITLSLKETLGAEHKTELLITDNIHLNTDEAAFYSILVNLYENAAKYSPKGTTVKIHLTETNTDVVLKVSDEGGGVQEQEINKIFLKFYRIGNEETRSNKGTGLGLYIVKNMVRMLEGKVAVKNLKTGGAEFEVILKK